MLETQAKRSRIPTPRTLLVEAYQSREGQHLYIYPFAGRNVHLGVASLIAWRLARIKPNTFSYSINDYGFELVSAEPFDIPATNTRWGSTHIRASTTSSRSTMNRSSAPPPSSQPRGSPVPSGVTTTYPRAVPSSGNREYAACSAMSAGPSRSSAR